MVADDSIRKLDTIFFPVTFLYRHSLELILKAIAFKYIKDENSRKAFLKDTFHNLSKILDEIEPFLTNFISKDINCYQWLKKLLESMNDIDKESDSFRYPFSIISDKNNKPVYRAKWIFEKQTHINIINLVNKMETAFEILNTYYLESYTKVDEYKNYNTVFLEEGGHYYGQSVIGFAYNRSEMHLYISGYKEAAKILMDEAFASSKKMNLNFLPSCYLYKNALELSLKDIVIDVFNTEKALEEIYRKKHSILGLWQCIENEVLKLANGSKMGSRYTYNYGLINEIHIFDGKSDKFRYPIDKHLDYHFKKQKKYNIYSFNKFFNQILTFLNGVSGMVVHHKEMQADYEMEMRNWSDE
ncbi:hypothetical protein EI200_20975 [Peribacillus simplex]|uniref:hypothetical protein n=1 Tax=Peribacillus simplex TaxID=1478 RepID=UPI000F6314C1|nr:hypothetical protein [Peribacillus simplex]RRN68029.1 hypothetical protein EI200_20975 [Peribacillus simplex]